MTTYVYETIPSVAGGQVKRFEFRQSMRDDPLTSHPETGEPIRRVILGGLGFISSAAAAKAPCPEGGFCESPNGPQAACCCAGSC